MHLSTKLFITLIAVVSWSRIATAETVPQCAWNPAVQQEPQAIVGVDEVWSGTRVDFAADVDGKHYVIGYYDRERWLTVARVDAISRGVRKERLPIRFDGWDSHNSVALAIDAGGIVHVAANMHASKLNYFRATNNESPMIRGSMTEQDDEHVTYPQFLKTADGNLLFLYRSGRSGDGSWLVNKWDGKTWKRVNHEALLGDRGFGGKVSGYPSRFTVSPDGFIHLAIVWRLTADAATNVRISYAKTRDFANWFDSTGRRLTLPLQPETTGTVLHTGPNKGLLNNAKVSIDAQGRAVIVFTRHNAAGRNTAELAVNDAGTWRIVPLAAADRGFAVKGMGSLPNSVALSAVDFAKPDRPMIYYRFPEQAGMNVALDPKTLAPSCIEKPASSTLARYAERSIPAMRPQIQSVGENASLVWSAQPANNDRQPPCTATAPLACNPPPSTLKLVIGGQPAHQP